MIDKKTKAILKTLSILYVEDEQEIQELFAESFQIKFAEVYLANNGKEGLEKFIQHSPDLIITDLKMPVMDGLTMIEKIREINETIPIIVITAYSDLENLKRALELDVDRFIQKPPSKKEMDRAIYKVASLITKQKEIDDRDLIIKTILGWHPYFSIICNDTDVQHVTSDFLGFLGFKSNEDFLENFKKMKWQSENDNIKEDIQADNSRTLFEYLSNEKDKKHFVYLENRTKQSQEVFEVKAKYFENTKLYLLSLFFLKDYHG